MHLRAAIVSVLAGLLAAAPMGAQQGTFKVSTNTVPIYATVMDSDKRLVPDLVEEDFEVYDNGKLQTLTSFDNRPLPITVVVMLDTSGSMTLALDLVKAAAEQFLLRMLPDDRGMVGAFNDKIEFFPDAVTGSRDELIRSLKELDFGYPTRRTTPSASMSQLKGIPGRKVVLVFTDGADNASRVGSGAMTDRARAEDVMIYSVGLENEHFNGQQRERSSPDRGLRRLSEETGGGFFSSLKKTDDLGPTFTRVAQELHSQYVLGFTPQALDGKVHKIEVRIKQKPSMSVRARKSYLASTTAVPGR